MTGAKLKIASSVPTVMNPPMKNRTVMLASRPPQVRPEIAGESLRGGAEVVMVAMVVTVITHWFAHDISHDGA